MCPSIGVKITCFGRMPDAGGHNTDGKAPGGFIMSFDPDGSDVELVATGFRNEYDIALNHDGELFTYDSDMEWDVGTPWYRPTRINHVISGGRIRMAKRDRQVACLLPPIRSDPPLTLAPDHPTGICFGYGTKFPKKYQDAMFVCDWSFGNIHVVHLQPDGSSYTGSYETFATRRPLASDRHRGSPRTGIVVLHDGEDEEHRARCTESLTRMPIAANPVNSANLMHRKLSGRRIAKNAATNLKRFMSPLRKTHRSR